jgi:endoribonuclease Dicer
VNLVFQQTNVLQCGLDHQVEGICGAMGSSLWQKSTWVRHFERNMVIVCTPEVLFQCMMHSFITMSQVNLLIFDEAHHAKNNHPYARLIKDYYLHEADLSKRPRIFGMTASPVDANVDISQAARDLEILLHCKIATTSDLSLLSNHIKKPEEKFAMYSRLKPRFETSFHQHMKTRYGHIKSFSKFFDDSKIFSSELGRWASDMYWTFSFSEDESRKIQQREERIHNKEKLNTVDRLNADIAQLNEAADYVRQYDFGTLSTTLEDLSSKVLQLHHWLNLYYERTDEARCIVSVERRQTARLLRLIFSHIGGPNLRSDVLMGNSSTIGDMKVTLRTQFLTVAKFRKGEINCLFATSVAEEGLDIPQCNLVVRFDLYRTMIAYVQSRGRARHRNSTYLHMIETDNALQRTVVHNALNAEKVMRNFCNGLSSDRLLNEVDDAATWLLANEEDFPTYTDPDSKAKLTYRSSLSVVDYFVATLPVANQEVNLQPTYVTTFAGGRFLCEVILPDCSPIISIRGHPQKKKTIAKCSAAFEMCLELRRKGFLDQHLLPTTMKKLPAMRNALLAISGKKKNLYDMRIKPSFWDDGFGTTPDRLYLTVVDVSAGLDRPHQPLGLITRAPFPQMPEFPVYLTDGRPSAVVTTPLAIPIKATDENLKLFTTLTLQIYQDIFAKTFEYDVAKMSYWLVPIQSDKTSSIGPHTDPESIIDWDQVNEACRSPEYRWTSAMSNDFLKDKYIVDPNDGGRRFYSICVAPNLKADDPVPNTAPRYKYMDSILEYSISLWAKSRVKWKDVWDHSQPVLEVEKIPFRRNHLARVEQDEDEVKTNMMTFVCPQPMRISTVSVLIPLSSLVSNKQTNSSLHLS